MVVGLKEERPKQATANKQQLQQQSIEKEQVKKK